MQQNGQAANGSITHQPTTTGNAPQARLANARIGRERINRYYGELFHLHIVETATYQEAVLLVNQIRGLMTEADGRDNLDLANILASRIGKGVPAQRVPLTDASVASILARKIA